MKKVIFCIIVILSIAMAAGASQLKHEANNSIELAAQGSITYSWRTGDDGCIYVKYNNTTPDYYLLKYKYTDLNGYSIENYIEVKPNVATEVQIGKGTNFVFRSCEPID